MHRILLAAPLLLLAACNGGTDISIDGENVSIHSNVAVSGANFDLNGIELYPGSTIRDFKLDAQDRKDGEDSGKVAVRFDSPGALAKVQPWFRDTLTKRGYALTAKGDGFAGANAEGDKVLLELTADGADKTNGRLEVGK
jgi:hypothetical protein